MACHVCELLKVFVNPFHFAAGLYLSSYVGKNRDKARDGFVDLAKWMVDDIEPMVLEYAILIGIKWY